MRLVTPLIVTGLIAFAGAATAAAPNGADGPLRNYLQRTLHAEGPLHFQAVDVDLDRDGVDEVVAYIDDPGFCGTGGCNTLILKRVGDNYRTVTNISVTHLPVRVLASRSHGWSDIGVTVAGGGILVAHETRLRFNGRSYRWNPTVRPAEPLTRTVGKILIKPPTSER